jgi:hypothetical protein
LLDEAGRFVWKLATITSTFPAAQPIALSDDSDEVTTSP